MPTIVARLLGVDSPDLVWHNEVGGLTYRHRDRFVKWSPRSAGIDLHQEALRLEWLARRHPAPRLIDFGESKGAQWMMTAALPGEMVVGGRWRTDPDRAIMAIAHGLRALHAVSTDGFPVDRLHAPWHAREPEGLGDRPPIIDPVLVHGDACAPNTLADDAGSWTGHCDVGDLGVGDRWADLAIAALSLPWNYEGRTAEMEQRLYQVYGVEPDAERIDYYRRLWHLES